MVIKITVTDSFNNEFTIDYRVLLCTAQTKLNVNIIIILTHDTPEGSIMCNSGPSGPWELNSTLQKSHPELHKETGMG